MRLWLIYISVLALGLTSFTAMISMAPSPESVILGDWNELAWEYERVNKSDEYDIPKNKIITNDIKSMIGKHLVIHEAETWTFLPNGRLRLSGNGTEKTVNWRIKGRGNILQLKHADNIIENYNLTALNEDSMVLNFESDIQARGIAKLTFQKIKN